MRTTKDAKMPRLQEIYDSFADTYEASRGLFDMTAIIDAFWNTLNQNQGHVLDLGCGAGEPFARSFIERGWQATGVDFSQRMLQLAEHYVPRMQCVQADMTKVQFPPASFDAVTAIYSLFHVPRERHSALFANIHNWLKPGGKLLFTYATRHYTGADEFDGTKEFMGKTLFYSHGTPEQLRTTLEAVGLKILREDWREIGGETFLWITATRSAS